MVWLATPTIRPRYLTGGHKLSGNSQSNIGKTAKTVDFSNIQGSVTKSGNVTFLFRLEGFLLNDTDWINDFKEKRTQYGVSQNQLAVMAGVSREYVSRLESGKVALTEEIKVKFTDALERLNPDNPLEMVLDYVRIRFPTPDVIHVVEDILKLRFDVMIHEDFGFYSYAEHYVLGDVFVLTSPDKEKGTLLELKGKGCRQMECYLLAQERSWYDFMLDCMTAGGVMKRLDLAINDKAGILDIPKLKEKYKAGECISYFRMQKDYSGTEKCGSDLPKNTGETLYLGSTSSELYMCAYQKNYEQYVKNGTEIEDTEIKNRFEIRMKNERAYYAVVDLLTYRDAERTAFSIINHYVRFVDREDDKPKSQWITNDDWAWFVGENREPIRLTTKPEPYTLQKALHWLQRQVAPTIKMVQALDRENRTTILKDMIEQAELKDKHKHLLQLEKSTIEERIDTAVPQENDGIF